MRPEATSLCQRPAKRRRQFHRYSVSSIDYVRDEIEATLSDPRIGFGERISRRADIRDTIAIASEGLLAADSRSLTPVASQPDIWELRWSYPHNVQYRLYFGETTHDSPAFVATHFHRKNTSVSAEEQNVLQNDAMALAQRRFDYGRADWWGHRRTRCPHCDWTHA